MALLEICCYSVDCACLAIQAGADRIELCAAVKEGGLTPSAGMLQQATGLPLPVHPIVRPRGGDFCYSQGEFNSMLRDIAYLRELGFPGLVTGLLCDDGTVDRLRMGQVMKAAGNMTLTFHRAFDMCCDPWLALEQLGDLGVARILTSGQQQTAEQGLELISELQAYSRGVVIMAGAGIRPNNIARFVAAGIGELHSSAGGLVPSVMGYRQAGVSMSADPNADEYSNYQVNPITVSALKAALAVNNMDDD